jgi:hypothetical protein
MDNQNREPKFGSYSKVNVEAKNLMQEKYCDHEFDEISISAETAINESRQQASGESTRSGGLALFIP